MIKEKSPLLLLPVILSIPMKMLDELFIEKYNDIFKFNDHQQNLVYKDAKIKESEGHVTQHRMDILGYHMHGIVYILFKRI